MGLPVVFTCAVNSNDIVARTVTSGDFSVSRDVIATLAPAMDIQVREFLARHYTCVVLKKLVSNMRQLLGFSMLKTLSELVTATVLPTTDLFCTPGLIDGS